MRTTVRAVTADATVSPCPGNLRHAPMMGTRKVHDHVLIVDLAGLGAVQSGDLLGVRAGDGTLLHIGTRQPDSADSVALYQVLVDMMSNGTVIRDGTPHAIGLYDPLTGLVEVGAAAGTRGRAAFSKFGPFPAGGFSVRADELGERIQPVDVAGRGISAHA